MTPATDDFLPSASGSHPQLPQSPAAITSTSGDTIPDTTPFASLSAEKREELLLEHMSSVRYIARRIRERLPQHVELDDLMSAGVIGLMDAFNKFDTRKNVQFKSYAQFRIRGAILDSLRELDWSPRELRRKGRAIETAISTLTGQLGRAPSEPEIAAELQMTLEGFQVLLGDLKGLEIGTLHTERNEDAGDEEINYIAAPEADDPFLQCMKSEMRGRLADAIDELPEREKLVLSLYYFEELTMKEIGIAIGVVESRVSQIHSAAVLRLRTSLTGSGHRKAAKRSRAMPPKPPAQGIHVVA
jgi:RNA polymerase sigma factor for flagellar operon FliA